MRIQISLALLLAVLCVHSLSEHTTLKLALLLAPETSLFSRQREKAISFALQEFNNNSTDVTVVTTTVQLTNNSLTNLERIEDFLANEAENTTAALIYDNILDESFISSLLEKNNIPVLKIAGNPPSTAILQLRVQEFYNAALHMLNTYNRKTVVIVFSSTYEEEVKDLLDFVVANGITVARMYRCDNRYLESCSATVKEIENFNVRMTILVADPMDAKAYFDYFRHDIPMEIVWIDPKNQIPFYPETTYIEKIHITKGFISITPPFKNNTWISLYEKLAQVDSLLFGNYSEVDISGVTTLYDMITHWTKAIEAVSKAGKDVRDQVEVKNAFYSLEPNLITGPHVYNPTTGERLGSLNIYNWQFSMIDDVRVWRAFVKGEWIGFPRNLNLTDVMFADGSFQPYPDVISPIVSIGVMYSTIGSREEWEIVIERAMNYIRSNPFLLSGYELRIVMEEGNDTVVGAMQSAIQLMERGAVGIIGPPRSGEVQAVQYYLGGLSMPLVSPTATADFLSDKLLYPSFVRTVFPDRYQVHAIVSLIRHFNWTRTCIVYYQDDYANNIADFYLREATAAGISVTRISFRPNTTEFTRVLDEIENSRCMEIIGVLDYKHMKLLAQAIPRNLFATPNMTWIFASITYTYIIDPSYQIEITSVKENALEGTFFVTPLQAPPDSTEFAEMVEEIRNRTGREPSAWASFRYDAILMLAHAIDGAVKSGAKATDHKAITDQLFKTSFNGMSGLVSIDSNGDRVGASFGIYNYQYARKEMVLVATLVDGPNEFVWHSDPIFSDGTTNVPVEPQPPIRYLKYTNGGIVLIIVVCLALFVFLISAIAVVVLQENRLIRRSSPMFLLVILFGLAMSFLSIYFWIGYPKPAYCHLRVWLGFLGTALAYGALLAKNARLYYLFNEPSLRIIAITNRQLLTYLTMMILPLMCVLVLWSSLQPFEVTLMDAPNGWEKYVICKSPNDVTFAVIGYVYMGILLVCGAILSFKTRVLPDIFKESWFIGLATYNILLVSTLCIIMGYILSYDAIASNAIICASFILGGGGTYALIFLPKFYAVRYRKEIIDNWSGTPSGSKSSTPMSKTQSSSTKAT